MSKTRTEGRNPNWSLPMQLMAANSMDPGEVPTQLLGLTDIEERLIARVHPIYEFTS